MTWDWRSAIQVKTGVSRISLRDHGRTRECQECMKVRASESDEIWNSNTNCWVSQIFFEEKCYHAVYYSMTIHNLMLCITNCPWWTLSLFHFTPENQILLWRMIQVEHFFELYILNRFRSYSRSLSIWKWSSNVVRTEIQRNHFCSFSTLTENFGAVSENL